MRDQNADITPGIETSTSLSTNQDSAAKDWVALTGPASVTEDYDPYLPFRKGASQREFLERSYGPELAENLMARLGSKGHPALIPLLNDPGVVNHFEKLEELLETLPEEDKKNPQTVYEALSEALGTETYYRALLLSEREASGLLSGEGLSSAFELYLNSDGAWDSKSAQRTLQAGYRNLLWSHTNPVGAMRGAVQSVSRFADVALAMANFTEDIAGAPKRDIYLVEMELPKIRCLDMCGNLANPDSYYGPGSFLLTHPNPTDRDTVYARPMGPEVESFVVGSIQRESITSVRRVDPKQAPINRFEGCWFDGGPELEGATRLERNFNMPGVEELLREAAQVDDEFLTAFGSKRIISSTNMISMLELEGLVGGIDDPHGLGDEKWQ